MRDTSVYLKRNVDGDVNLSQPPPTTVKYRVNWKFATKNTVILCVGVTREFMLKEYCVIDPFSNA